MAQKPLGVTAFAQALADWPGAAEFRGPEIERCAQCGSRFDRRLNQRRRFCSRRCRYAYHELGRAPQRRLPFAQ